MAGRPVRWRIALAMAFIAFGTGLLEAHTPLTGRAQATAAGLGHGKRGAHQAVNLARLRREYGALPLRFEANRGQTDSRVRFLARGSGYTLFLTAMGAVLALAPQQAPAADGMPDWTHPLGTSAVLWLNLSGANRHAPIVGTQRFHGASNYFAGKHRRAWRANVPAYARVVYRGVYPGVDAVYYGNQGHLEYDFRLAPHANPRRLKLDIEGAWWLSLDARGNLVMHTAAGNFVQARPVLYQMLRGKRHTVHGRYLLLGPHLVGFQVGRYDARRPLVIDPVLSYSTYLGGSGGDYGVGIAVDSAGNAYITGRTLSSNFPGTNALPALGSSNRINGGSDAFVTKLDAAGTAQDFVTYLGGNSINVGFGVAVDGSGNVIVAGATKSTAFPTLNAAQNTFGGGSSDAFVTKLNPAGDALIFSTYLGGTGWDFAGRVALDPSGNIYVAGATSSSNFPTTSAWQVHNSGGLRDAFVTKLSPTGALMYSSYLGGSGLDEAAGIAVDSAGNAYVTGLTQSQDFPTLNALQASNAGKIDAFVSKLNSAGALVYSTYLGGSGVDSGNGIAVDSAGEAYVVGSTYSTDFPTANAFQSANGGGSCRYPWPWSPAGACSDAFVAKLSADGKSLLFSTYLGGTGNEVGRAIAVDSNGAAYITGDTTSANLPLSNAVQAAYGGGIDAFVARFDASGALDYNTYLGGSGYDSGYGIAVDGNGNAFVTGLTTSSDFPTTSAFQGANGGGGDAFVSEISPSGAIVPTPTPTITLTPTVAATATMTPTDTATAAPSTSTTTPTAGSCGSTNGVQPQWKATLTAIAQATATAVAGATETAVAAATCTATPIAATATTTATATPSSTVTK